jgi:capsular exopolysaccharide synthesis family protein
MNNQFYESNAPAPWEQDPSDELSGDAFPILDYLQLLWFRKKLIIAITIFVGAVGWIQVNEIRSIYTASSKLMVGTPQSNVVNIEEVLTRDIWGDAVLGEIEVIKSRGLAAKVVERLNLVNYQEFNPRLRTPEKSFFDFLNYADPRLWIPVEWKQMLNEALGRETKTDPVEPPTEEELLESQKSAAASILLGKISVEEVEYASVITISVSSWDPKMAARIANDLPEAYILDQLEARFEATEKANIWLTEQLAELETTVAESERAVEIYREEYGLPEDRSGGLLDTQLSELNSQLIVARANAAEIDARLAQINRLQAGGGPGLETMTEVMSSPLIQQLRSQELEVTGRMSELSVEFGPKHPRMLQVRAELAEIREWIKAEIGNVKSGLENESDFARTKVRSLEASLREVQGLSSEQNKEAVQLRALEREAAANRTLFETFLGRFKETSSTQGMETSDARVISAAQAPGGPSYPDRNKQFTTFVLMGFLGACALVLGLHCLSPGMTSPERIQQALREFVIGLIPKISGRVALHDYVLKKPKSGPVEAINSLKFSLALSNPDIEVKAVQVTSSLPEEGKTSLALALARVVAASGKNVILVDGDLRRSSIVKKLKLKRGHKGLSDLVVADDQPLSDFIMRDERGQMDFMPIGTAEYANAGDIFSSHRMEHIVGQLKARYDMVVVDAPPVMAVTDARIIGRMMDKTLFVLRWQKTPRKVAQAALDQLRRADVDIAGVVLQQVDIDRYGRMSHGESGYYYQYGRYGKYYSG